MLYFLLLWYGVNNTPFKFWILLIMVLINPIIPYKAEFGWVFFPEGCGQIILVFPNRCEQSKNHDRYLRAWFENWNSKPLPRRKYRTRVVTKKKWLNSKRAYRHILGSGFFATKTRHIHCLHRSKCSPIIL